MPPQTPTQYAPLGSRERIEQIMEKRFQDHAAAGSPTYIFPKVPWKPQFFFCVDELSNSMKMKALLNLPEPPRAQSAFVHGCKIVNDQDGTPGVRLAVGERAVGVAYFIEKENQLEGLKSCYPESRYRFTRATMTLLDSGTVTGTFVGKWW